MLAIVVPTTTELAGIRRQIRDAAKLGVSIYVSGVGKSRAIASMDRIIAEGPDTVVMAGFCGASDPSLTSGDLHVAHSFHAKDRSGNRYKSIAANQRLVSVLTNAARSNGRRVVTDPSTTVPSVAGIAAKAAVRSDSGAASVNMEDYWAAYAARSGGIPFASVRAVLDTADQELPPWISHYAGNVLHVACGLIINPGRVPTLLHLWRQALLARHQLTRCLLTAVAALAPPQSVRMEAPR